METSDVDSNIDDQLPELLQPPELNSNDASQASGAWSSGLCGCCKNPLNALVTLFCPCVTFGQVAEMVDEGNIKCCISTMVYIGCCFCFSYGACKLASTYRSKLRRKFNIPESPTLDWVTHCCCPLCALCQEYRELQSRGFNPRLGWKRNEARKREKNEKPSMRPPTNQRMKN